MLVFKITTDVGCISISLSNLSEKLCCVNDISLRLNKSGSTDMIIFRFVSFYGAQKTENNHICMRGNISPKISSNIFQNERQIYVITVVQKVRAKINTLHEMIK